MTEKQKKLGLIKGLELFQPDGDKNIFFDYLEKLTLEAQEYILPVYLKINLIKYKKTRSGKYKIYLHEKQVCDRNQLDEIIKKINNNELFV